MKDREGTVGGNRSTTLDSSGLQRMWRMVPFQLSIGAITSMTMHFSSHVFVVRACVKMTLEAM